MSKADAGRILHISQQRERTKEDIEKQKKKLEEERQQYRNTIQTKFTTNVDQTEEKLKAATVGLVTLDEMKERTKELLQQADDIVTGKANATSDSAVSSSSNLQPAVQKRVLSFGGFDDEEDEEPVVIPKKRLGMDPTVDTTFLPDKDREAALIKRKEELAQEWRALQEKEKNEEILVAFCYFDGSSRRKDTKMKKGATIGQFLQKAAEMFRREFTELRTATTENLMRTSIIPHHFTFQDFIVAKVMGKTGPLWQFECAGEIRVRQDAALDIGEAHPVVLRSWYEKNKHIYPASRWEPFVAGKEYKRALEDLTKI
ncbi:Protein FAM50-like protein [Aphelenchoides fujianensis]|nr:Protein FAM50-like protein [Aphelenchoides fujianensis]